MLGPQGSGKGTQSEMLSLKLKIPKIATGDIFREEIIRQSELGLKAKGFINSGKLVPSELTNEMVLKRLSLPDVQKSFILDGFPRNLIQAEALEKKIELTHVLEIWISDKEAIHRLSGRRSCVCGKVYHLVFKPPKHDEFCDECKRKLFIRDDDKPESIKARLQIYHKETEPLKDFYFKKGILLSINGEQSIVAVSQEILKKLGI